MKLSKRESLLIALAVFLLGVTIAYKYSPGFRWQSGLTEREILSGKLIKAEALIRREAVLRRQSARLAKLERKLIRHTDPKKSIVIAVGDLSKVAALAGICPEMIKPGTLQNTDGLSFIPVQIEMNTSIPLLMNLLVALRKQLPTVRIMHLNIAPASGPNCNVALDIQYFFPGMNGGENSRRKFPVTGAKPRLTRVEDVVKFLQHRMDDPFLDKPKDWTGLSMALGLQSTGSERPESTGLSDQPALVGIVSQGDRVQALVQCGIKSWFLSPGEFKGGIRLLSVYGDGAVISYQNRVIRLKLATLQ